MKSTTQDENPSFDRHAPVRELLHLALIRVIEHRQAWRADGDCGATPLLRDACDLARGQDLLAEQLVVILKESWWRLSETKSLERVDAEDALGIVVCGCIREYYRLNTAP